ncbi:hypothetical protein Patl1_29607 [Pistacia atlantica]|uniref:Uncharacterized protein n=1 Tax=Pistacia atlantica TaxID=434234 RepID=A0ACC1A801_9ROSI|nr:hypothetical protein Patl1_29607 [Pistacia atlantica]
MDPSISKDGTGNVPTKIAASTTSEPKRFLKRSEAQVDLAQTLQEPEQETTSAQKKRVQEALRLSADECSRPLNKCNIDQLLKQIRAALNQHDGISTPEGIKLIKDLTSYELQMVLIHCLSDEVTLRSISSLYSVQFQLPIFLQLFQTKTHFDVYCNKVEATISDQKKSIADLKASLALYYSIAKLQDSMFESTRACHNSRVKSLEAELESKHAEIKGLKKQATASEQKASRLKRRH